MQHLVLLTDLAFKQYESFAVPGRNVGIADDAGTQAIGQR
jgi:hypothetical protein